MHHEPRKDWPVGSAMWVAVRLLMVTALGLIALVGSGGGGFPPCDAPFCSNTPSTPLPAVSISPQVVTALVGAPVRFDALASHYPAAVSYQWQRSGDGGSSWVDIAGATASSYALAAVNLADDEARFHVTVRSVGSVTLGATARLLVSATPGIVFHDGEFRPQDWSVSDARVIDRPPLVHSELALASGGNPGAFRRISFTLPADAGVGGVVYLSNLALYTPQQQGALRAIDYAEDCFALQPSDIQAIQAALAIEQAGRTYLLWSDGRFCNWANWQRLAQRAGLEASDFSLFYGPACGAAEHCPDFSATAPPLRFGHLRSVMGRPGDVIDHGVDNWSVTVWRR